MRIKNTAAQAASRKAVKAVIALQTVKADSPAKAKVAREKAKAALVKAAPSKAKAKGNAKATVAAKASAARIESGLADMAVAGFAYARAHASVTALIKVTGATKAARKQFIIGYMAARSNPAAAELSPAMLSKATTAFNAKGKDSKGKVAKGQARRTEEQERAYGAARKAWHLIVKAAGVEAADKRGGANNKGKANAGKVPAKAPASGPVQVAPKAKSGGEATAYVMQQAAMLLAFANKNAALLKGPMGEAVIAFHKAALAAAKPE